MSSTNEPMPRRSRGSSFLCTAGMHALRRQANGFDDVLVARAAAQVAAQCLADLVVGGPRALSQECQARDQHARGTEAALQAMGVPERLLERVQLFARSKALNRRDV